MISARTLIRHLSAAILLFAAWKFLNSWYKFQHSSDYLIFAVLTIFGIAIGAGPFLTREIRNISRIKILLCLPLILLLLPWAEWLQLGTIYTRETWSEKLFLEGVFIYGVILLLQTFPKIAAKIHNSFLKIIEKLSLNQFLLRLPPILLFLVTSYVAIFVFRETSIVQDSSTHLFQAHVFGKFKLYAPAPPFPEAFTGPIDLLILKDGKWFGFGFPAFAALLAPATWLNLEWLVSPLLAAVTALIWIAYAWKWHNGLTAALLGWLLLLCPFIIVMSSTVMVFTPELFFASAIIYFCRLSLEKQSFLSLAALFICLVGSVLVRPFSILPFMFPIVFYTFVKSVKQKRFLLSSSIVFGVLAGVGCLLLYLSKTTGHPFVTGYQLEVPTHSWGFGLKNWETYPPLMAIGNVSNNMLGLNEWLGGWYSGSMLFIFPFFLRNKLQKWDKLLLASCGILILFYFFYYIQDLFFGPRFYYLFAPILLLFLARTITNEQTLSLSGKSILVPLMVITILVSLPKHLPGFIKRYSPKNSQAGQLKDEIRKNGNKKTLVFLDKDVGQNFVNWNDPFLKSPLIICRDIGSRNIELKKYFSDYHPVWFRMEYSIEKGKITSGFRFSEEPSKTPQGSLSLFELAMALQAASNYPRRDFFDITYVDLFTPGTSQKNYAFLERAQFQVVERGEYKRRFRSGVAHAGKMLLLPKIAYEEAGGNWYGAFNAQKFRQEFNEARQSFEDSGDIGVTILDQMKKVEARIDRNSDHYLSDDEIRIFLVQKIKLLSRGGAL